MSEARSPDDDVRRIDTFRDTIDRIVTAFAVLVVVALTVFMPLFLVLIWVALALAVFTRSLRAVMPVLLANRIPSEKIPRGPTGDGAHDDRDAAYRFYLLGPAWQDCRRAAAVSRGELAKVRRSARVWARQVLRAEARRHVLLPLWLAALAGLTLTAGAWVVAVGITAGLCLFLGLLSLAVWSVAVGAFIAADWLISFSRRIHIFCPYPPEYSEIKQPRYECPGEECGETHKWLHPSSAGGLWHRCRCGTLLPTLIVLGRHRLQARCSDCNNPLPRRVGTVRIQTIPFVGGTAAGKSTLMALMLRDLRSLAVDRGARVMFARQDDAEEQESALASLDCGQPLRATQTRLPTAVAVDVRARRERGRILSLFDVAGEVYGSRDKVANLRYLRYTKSLVVVIDPLALPAITDFVGTAIRGRPLNSVQAEFRADDPASVLERVISDVLKYRQHRPPLSRIAIVVTKADIIADSPLAPPGGEPDDIRRWLIDVAGVGNLVEMAEGAAREVRYAFSRLDSASIDRGELLAWTAVLDTWRSGIVTQPSYDEEPLPARKRRVGMTPPSYLCGRLTILVASGLGALAALTGALAAAFILFRSLYGWLW